MARNIVIAPTPVALAEEAARRFVAVAGEVISQHGVFSVALSGGTTPKALYQVLATDTFRDQVAWDKVQIFFSDERFVPPDSPDSNFRTANEAMLSQISIPDRFVHPVPTVGIEPDEAARNYEEGIRRIVAKDATGLPRFDLILLGLGPDGHTASLFPGTAALEEEVRLVVPNYVAKFDSWRITFTYPLINAAARVFFLSQGEEKAERVFQVLSGQADLPATGVHPGAGELVWLLDDAAAASSHQFKT